MHHIAFTTFLCLAVAGCSDTDVEKIRKVGDKTYDRAAAVVQQTWDELGRTLLDEQPAKPQYDLLTKIQLRLKWEKDLETLPITATLAGDTIILAGSVKTKEQKEKAAKLAEATQGVTKLKDEITVNEPEKPIAPQKGLPNTDSTNN